MPNARDYWLTKQNRNQKTAATEEGFVFCLTGLLGSCPPSRAWASLLWLLFSLVVCHAGYLCPLNWPEKFLFPSCSAHARWLGRQFVLFLELSCLTVFAWLLGLGLGFPLGLHCWSCWNTWNMCVCFRLVDILVGHELDLSILGSMFSNQ